MITKEYLQQELRRRIDSIKIGFGITTKELREEMESILVLVDALQDRVKDYDDALEKAKAAHKDTDKHIKATVERIFPELHESEDERIRKYIIDELKVAKSVGELKFTIPQPTREECIAYLEKQKEQKPAEWSEEDKKTLWSAINGLNIHIYEKERAWLANKLKSLRPQPHWKPSEEQISSLKQARDYYMSGRIKYVGRHLSEIAEQLEKLM